MNTHILKKCLDELGKETPDLSYVRGMLEVLAMSEENPPLAVSYTPKPMPVPGWIGGAPANGTGQYVGGSNTVSTILDEGSSLDHFAAAKIAEVQRLAGESLE